MFFRRSTRQPAPQQVQGEQAVSASTSMPALELESVSVFTELPEGGHLRRAAAVEGSALSGDQRRERIRELLRERGLERLEDQSVFTLSGGEKQLVALTSVLAARPQILLLDEPTTLLDLRNRARLLKHLESLDQMLVLSTHDLDLAASCDEAVIIHDGRLLAQGDAAQLVQQYRTWCAEGFPNEGATEGLDSSGGAHGR